MGTSRRTPLLLLAGLSAATSAGSLPESNAPQQSGGHDATGAAVGKAGGPEQMKSPGRLLEWNDAHSGEAAPAAPHKKHQFAPQAKDCAELNTDRFEDAEMVATDNWVGGFYMEVYVDGARGGDVGSDGA